MEAISNILSQDKASTERGSNKESLAALQCKIYNESEGRLNQEDNYECPICKNKGHLMAYRAYGEDDFEIYMYDCKCLKARASIRRMQRSGLKSVIKELTFDKYETPEEWQKTIKEAAQRFVKDDEHGYFFIGGQSGAGKTAICTAICREYLLKGKEVNYMLWTDEVAKLKGYISEKHDKYVEAMEALKNVDVLYIDDLFKTAPTIADIRLAFEIINARYIFHQKFGKKTIISTECTLDDLINIDEALGGRIAQYTMEEGYGFSIAKDRKKNWRLRYVKEM